MLIQETERRAKYKDKEVTKFKSFNTFCKEIIVGERHVWFYWHNSTETDKISMVSKYERFYLPQNVTTRGINLSYRRDVSKTASTEFFCHRVYN